MDYEEMNYQSFPQGRQWEVSMAFPVLMRKTYMWMSMALVLTGLSAFVVATNATISNFLFTYHQLIWVLFLAEIGLVIGLSAAINKISLATATLMFVAYAILNGVTLSSLFYVYTMMSFTGDAIDHVEYSQNVRVEGITAALVGFMHSFANGIGQGLFNLGLMVTKYVTPEAISTIEKKGKIIEVFADQPAAATTWINFSYQGAIALTAILFFVLFMFFFDIDKKMPAVQEELTERKKAECAAKGILYVSPLEQQRAEIAKQQAEAEEIRIKELKEKCAKHGLDFDTENQKYLAKVAAKKAKKEAKKAKKQKS